MIRLTFFELYKMARRPRSYIGFVAFALINFFVMLAGHYGGFDKLMSRSAPAGPLSAMPSPLDAEFMAWLVVGSPMAMPILIMWIPVLVSLIFGEIFAGESAEGTLRTLLCAPIKRGSLFAAKLISSSLYTISLIFFLGISAFLYGWAAFGHGGLITTGSMMHPSFNMFVEEDAIRRLVLAYSLTCAVGLAVGMMAFFISTWLSNALGAIGTTVMVLFTTFVVGEIPYFSAYKPYLLGSQILIGQNAFADPIPWHAITLSLLCLGSYFFGFLIISALVFKRKDILA